MSNKNGTAKAAKKKAKKPAIELHVGPRTGKASREVVAKRDDVEFTDVLDTSKASAREKFIVRLSKKWGIDLAELQDLDDLLVQRAQDADALAEQAAEQAAEEPAIDKTAKALKGTDKKVIKAAKAFLKNPKLMDELAEDFKKLAIAGETDLAKTEYIVGTSRLLERPLGASVKSASSSGKSYVTEIITSLFPPEHVLEATDITANALYYMTPGSLIHLLIVVGERKHMNTGDDAGTANATLALREMQSRGRLDKLVPMKMEGGQIRTGYIVQEGPIAYLETTTQQEIFEEDSTRMLSLATDESAEQTAAIMKMQAQKAAWKTASVAEQEAIRLKHKTAQRLLKCRKVRIGFAEKLLLPDNTLVARRAFPQLLAFIEVVALLRQFQKTKVHVDGHIEATANDYEIAYELMHTILRRTFAPLSQRALTLLGTIRDHTHTGQTFDRSDCKLWSGVSITEVRNRLNLLVEAGMVEQVTGGKGGCATRTRSSIPSMLSSLRLRASLLRKGCA